MPQDTIDTLVCKFNNNNAMKVCDRVHSFFSFSKKQTNKKSFMITFFPKKKGNWPNHITYDMRDKNQFIQWRFQIIVGQFCLK